MGFFDALLKPKPSPADEMRQETEQMRDHKKQALKGAIDRAHAEGRKEATFTDYLIAAEELGEKLGLPADKWNSRSYSDLSGQKIKGFAINERDMKAPDDTLHKQAVARAAMQANANMQPGAPRVSPSTAQVLKAMQDIQNGETPPGVEQMENFLDLDADHAIAKMYADVDHQAKFHNTIFEHCSFHPAGTLMHNGQDGLALTNGAKFDKVVFDGLSADDHVVMAAGRYEDIKIINSTGGTLGFAKGAHADGVDVSTGNVALEFGANSSVKNLNARGAHIVSIHAEPGAHISHAHFEGATIDMASKLQGSVWQDVHFEHANLGDVDMRGVNIKGLHVRDTHVEKMNLSGANIVNMSIDGKPVTSVDQLRNKHITVDAQTRVSTTPEFVMEMELGQIGKTLTRAIESIGQPVPPVPERSTIGPAAPLPAGVVIASAAPEAISSKSEKPTDKGGLDYLLTEKPAIKPEMPKDPVLAALQVGKDIATSGWMSAEYKLPESKPAAAQQLPANRDNGREVDLRSYYAEMSARNGRLA